MQSPRKTSTPTYIYIRFDGYKHYNRRFKHFFFRIAICRLFFTNNSGRWRNSIFEKYPVYRHVDWLLYRQLESTNCEIKSHPRHDGRWRGFRDSIDVRKPRATIAKYNIESSGNFIYDERNRAQQRTDERLKFVSTRLLSLLSFDEERYYYDTISIIREIRSFRGG